MKIWYMGAAAAFGAGWCSALLMVFFTVQRVKDSENLMTVGQCVDILIGAQ